MIPILYSPNESDFTSRGLGPLYDATECTVYEELNGDYSLELKCPVNGMHMNELQLYAWIEASVERNHTECFRIDHISRPMGGIVTVHAVQSAKSVLWQPVGGVWKYGTAQDVLDAVKAGIAQATYYLYGKAGPFGSSSDGKTLYFSNYTLETDITEKAGILQMTPRTLEDVLMGEKDSFVSEFGAEIEYYGTAIRILTHRGSDKGFSYRYSVNVSELTEDLDATDTLFQVLPYWIPKAADESKQKFEGPVFVDACGTRNAYVDQKKMYLNSEKVKLFDVGDSYTDNNDNSVAMTEKQAASLGYDEANRYSWLPAQSLDVTGANLDGQEVSLGDTVYVYVDPLDIHVDARVTQTEWDSLADRYTKMTIGVPKQSLSTTIKKVANS